MTGPLARVWRHPAALTLRLRPFGEADAFRFVESIAAARPSPVLVDELLEATGGNAFLLRSVVTRHLASERLTARGGRLALGDGGRIVAPVDLDDEIRLRLDQVDAAAREVLLEAAFLGDDAPIDELRAVHNARGAVSDVARAVASAVDIGVLVADDERYRFAHPQIRSVLYGVPARAEAEELHAHIARALVDLYGTDAAEHALVIAHHLERAGTPADPAATVEWALLAATRAWASSAWSRAMHSYELALRWAVDAADDDRLEWLLRSGIASYMAHDTSAAHRLRRAAAAARELGDTTRWAEAVLLLARFTAEDPAARLGQPLDTSDLEELLAELDDDQPALQVRTLATLAETYLQAGQLERVERCERDAERVLATSHDNDPAAVLRLSLAIGNHRFRTLRFDAARAQFERARSVDDGARQPDLAIAASTRLGLVGLATGDLAQAERWLSKVRDDRLGAVVRERQLATVGLATAAAARGELGFAERLATDALALYRLNEYVYTPGSAYPLLAISRALRGDSRGAARAIDEWHDDGGRGTWRYRALVDAWAGGVDAVDPQVASRPWRLSPDVDMWTLDVACVHIELAGLLGRADAIEPAVALLEEAHERGARFTMGWPWSVPRMLGDAWLLLEKFDEATRWYSAAAKSCQRAAARVEHARAELGLARASVLDGRVGDAMTPARDAALALDAVGALALARDARAIASDAGLDVAVARPALRAILITDLGDSTALNVRAGDDAYVRLLAEHDRVIRQRLAEHDGVEFKHTGDGLCAWFASAGDAVHCALGIRDDLERLVAAQPELPLAVRTGISAGEPVDTGDDLFGLAVVLAARVCGLANPGQVFVSDEVVQLTRGKPLVFHERGEFELKGLPGTTTVFEALRL